MVRAVEHSPSGPPSACLSGEALVYAYYDGVDRIAHATGFGELYDARARLRRLAGRGDVVVHAGRVRRWPS